ncbi:unnamed protein product [Cylindrotheca closterium]|uniref:PARP catalytic domain-containing protein n=1 Tax=Cylindrotheca closterium TaxID=2856 RepID=A0AAD2JIT9_9STRA|nr:unnamed protein product [Cylindrotheca closterium]
MAAGENDDEIAQVLQHFRVKPDFLTNKGQRRKRDKHSVHLRYVKDNKCLELFCLHLHVSKHDNRMVLRLKFRISTRKPHTVMYQSSKLSKPAEKAQADEKLRQIMDNLCETVSRFAEARIEELSLFSVISKLLAALNGKIIFKQLAKLQLEISQSFCTDGAKTGNKQVYHLPRVEKMKKSTEHCMDLQVFLMRCAATSKSRTTMVTPVPPGDLWSMAVNNGMTAPLVLATTNESIAMPLTAFPQTLSTKSTTQQYEIRCARQELCGYLSCLPWTFDGHVSAESSTKALKSGANIRVVLSMEDAMGDDLPRFEKLADERGVATAYHGTKLNAVWSILNHGLLNLSGTQQCQHGAMLGSGVYVSPSLQVAEFFAKSTELQPNVFWQWVQNQQRKSSIKDGAAIPWLDDMQITATKDFNIACRAVVQTRIILPPTRSSPRKGGTAADFQNATRRDGKYFVVPNDQDIQITKIHLTFEFQKKRSNLLAGIAFCLLILLGVLLKRALYE